ncbi:MAG TPA: hypothetical protein VNQ73_22710 [Ilumatobacter sp.]|nr:hypothetical protein [Ilumatobacter sp.]
MALPRALKPSALIRHKALYAGIFGPSKFWRLVAVWVFGRSWLKKFFGRNEEVLDVGKLGAGRFLSVETSKPVPGRKRRKLAKAGTPLPSRKELRALAKVEAEAAHVARNRRRR